MRDLTKEESEAYEESLRNISKPTGVNFNDLMGEKSMSDFKKFKRFFDEIGIKYVICDSECIIHIDGFEESELNDADIDIQFWPDGSYERFLARVYN